MNPQPVSLADELRKLPAYWRSREFDEACMSDERDTEFICAEQVEKLLAQHAVAEPQTLGQRMGTGAPAVLLQKIEAILGCCVFDQSDSLTYDEGVKLVRELVAPAHAAEQPKLTEERVGEMFDAWWQRHRRWQFRTKTEESSQSLAFAAWNAAILFATPAIVQPDLLTSPVAPNEQIFSGAELGDSVNRVAPVADGSSPSKAPSNIAAHAESSKLTLLESQAQSILTNCCQLLDSVKSEWAPENCWSDWDQSVRDAASAWLKDSYDLIAAPVTGYHCGACGAELGDSVKRVAPVADGSSPSKAPLPAPPVQEQASDEGPNCGCSEAPECTHTLYWWMGYKAGEVFAAKLAREEALEEIINLLPGKPREIGSAQLHAGYYAGLEAYRQAIRALAAQPAPQKEGVK